MKIFIDIDETICITPGDKGKARDYSKAIPIQENIDKANKLYDEGNTITYWTSRGQLTGQDWTNITFAQLDGWGVKYHRLNLSKPPYDLFIGDKVLNTEDWK